MSATRTMRLIRVLILLAAIRIILPARAESTAEAKTIFQAIREGDTPTVARLVAEVRWREATDARGDTALMAAAQLGTTEQVRLLLDAGARPDRTNDAGVSPLLRAAAEPEKVRLLLEHGARPNASSQLGITPLLLAARSPAATESVRLLLERGADANARSVFGATPLMAAAAAANLHTVRLLVEHGADVNAAPAAEPGNDPIWGGLRTPLMWAAFRNDTEILDYLLDHGARINDVSFFGTALTQTGWGHAADAARWLLDHGANPRLTEPFSGYSALHWAASVENGQSDVVDLLLRHGADPNAEGGQPVDAFLGIPRTPLMLAMQRGETPVTEALKKGGAHGVAPAEACCEETTMKSSGPDDAKTTAAVLRALGPLQHTSTYSLQSFTRHASHQKCASCHQQYFPLAAIGLSRSQQIPTDTRNTETLVKAILTFHDTELDRQPLFHPEPAVTYGYAMMALRMSGITAPDITDSLVAHLATLQNLDGHWDLNLFRPPLQSTPITSTALAIQALRHFGWPARQGEFQERVARARAWLAVANADTHEARVYQVLGLHWAGAPASDLRPLAEALLREQRGDGGWGQLPALPSDAYATGQTVFALETAAGMKATAPAIRRAIAFLLDSQEGDGTWHIRRRAFPFQPTMDSGFPHGRDAWISAAGTSWAVIALCRGLDGTPHPTELSVPSGKRPDRDQAGIDVPATRAGATGREALSDHAVDFETEIRPLLEKSCMDCHSGERPRSHYQLTSRDGLVSIGNQGRAAVVPGRADESQLLRYVAGEVEDLEMPPTGKRDRYPALTAPQVALLRTWIAQGAPWPAGVELRGSN